MRNVFLITGLGIGALAAQAQGAPQAAVLASFRSYCGFCHAPFKHPDDGVVLAALKAQKPAILAKLAWDAAAPEPTTGNDGRMPPMSDQLYPAPAPNLYKALKSQPGVKAAMVDLVASLDDSPPPGPLPNLPLGAIKLPPGFKIAVFAAVPGARSMTLSAAGTLFVGTGGLGSSVDHTIYVLPHAADVSVFPGTPLTITTGVGGAPLAEPNGLAVQGDTLYVAEWNRIIRYDHIDGFWNRATPPAAPVDLTGPYFQRQKYHEWKFLAFGPDGKLYVNIGAHDNIHAEEDPYATIVRLDPDGSHIEIYARGVRNSVGFDWHPTTHELWFTDNGCDQLGPDAPPDELNRAPTSGMHFGFPFCFGRDNYVDTYANGRSCADSTPPAALLDPHAAAIGMRFYQGAMFPAAYQGAIFIAEHGSWARAQYHLPPTGYQVVVAKLNGNEVASVEPFATGWSNYKTDGAEHEWGRPTDVLVMPDGALLVSDSNGVIYRISYAAP